MIQGSLLGFPEFQVIVRCELFDSRVHAGLMGNVVVRREFDALEEGINGGIFERRLVEGYFSIQSFGDVCVQNNARLFVPGEV